MTPELSKHNIKYRFFLKFFLRNKFFFKVYSIQNKNNKKSQVVFTWLFLSKQLINYRLRACFNDITPIVPKPIKNINWNGIAAISK